MRSLGGELAVWFVSLSVPLVAACDAAGGMLRARDGGAGDGSIDLADSDGDTIADDHEGRKVQRDTDSDDAPDFRDPDSDGDGLPDSLEAGDRDAATAPIDSDADGDADFVDLDSDNNGIPDGDEPPGDLDGDRLANSSDLDDDNDGISDARELAGGASPTQDTDGDGVVDHQDPDSDNDTIRDGDERDADTDMDGMRDAADRDSDNDGLTDAIEAGDSDLTTAPVDTDMDTIPDFRDADADNDGLGDRAEVEAGTSPVAADSDRDGVSDLIEIAAGTDPARTTDSPRTRGDFVFTVPYMQPPDPVRDTLRFRTSIQFADVYFLFDTTTSMSGEIGTMRSAVQGIVANITCESTTVPCTTAADCEAIVTPSTRRTVCGIAGVCVEDPAESSCIASVWTGVGRYWGEADSYVNDVALQPDSAVTRTGIPASAIGAGAAESLFESVACVADPTVCPAGNRTCRFGSGSIGTPCFRADAIRILVAITDEQNECGTTCSANTAAAAGARLATAGITFVGIDADAGHEPRTHLRAIATESQSFDRSNNPLVFDGDGAAVEMAVTRAINEIVEGVPLRVTIRATDEPSDDGDALRFIERLETNGSATGCTALATQDTNADGYPDAFPSVTPGTPVCWDVVPRMNNVVMPELRPLVFRARLTVYGDGSPLDSRRVFFLVPPRIPEPGMIF